MRIAMILLSNAILTTLHAMRFYIALRMSVRMTGILRKLQHNKSGKGSGIGGVWSNLSKFFYTGG